MHQRQKNRGQRRIFYLSLPWRRESKYKKNTSLTPIFSIFFVLGVIGLSSGCASLPDDVQRTPSYAATNTKDTSLGKLIAPVVKKHSGNSGFYLLKDGIDAFVARMAIVTEAQKTLDIQYYIWHSDMTGRLLFDNLIRAADRGVRVRLLLDDLDTAGKELGLHIVDSHPNIEVRIYNPFSHRGSRAIGFLTELSRVNRRMHNKSLTADNQATIVGGRNIGNEYFGAESASAFSDLDVLAIGPIVKDVSKSFDTYWNSPWVYPIAAFKTDETDQTVKEQYETQRNRLSEKVEQARSSPYATAVRQSKLFNKGGLEEEDYYWGQSKLLYDAPSKAEGGDIDAATHIGPHLAKLFKSAEDELIIISPYFVPGTFLVDYLGEIVKQGTRVRILTNALAANDVGVVHAGYMRYRLDLLKRGIELYEYKPTLVKGEKKKKDGYRWSGSSKASLHAKTFAIDRQWLFVGSFNLDPRSVDLNTEMGVIFESPELVTRLSKNFDERIIARAYRLERVVIPESESESGFEEESLRWVTLENGKKVVYDTEPHTSLWRRFTVGLLSIFVIESFL